MTTNDSPLATAREDAEHYRQAFQGASRDAIVLAEKCDALAARVRELEDVERTLNESCAWYYERVQRLEMALASIRIGELESVNIRNGVAFSYCPECGTEQGPPESAPPQRSTPEEEQ